MSHSVTKPTWSPQSTQGTIMDPGYQAPSSYTMPNSQYVAQESNLRHMLHLAGMTNMASFALGTVLFDLYSRNLLLAFPIMLLGMEEPLTFEWFLSILQLIGSSMSQLAYNAVSAAMNLQTIQREAFIAGDKSGLSPDNRERLHLGPEGTVATGESRVSLRPQRGYYRAEGQPFLL